MSCSIYKHGTLERISIFFSERKMIYFNFYMIHEICVCMSPLSHLTMMAICFNTAFESCTLE